MSELEETLIFQIKATKLTAPTLEHRFHPTRKWRFDLAWPDQLVACEVEGGSWVNGAHSRGAHFASDCEKYNEAALLGWRVLRVDNHMVKDGRALAFVERALTPKPSVIVREGRCATRLPGQMEKAPRRVP